MDWKTFFVEITKAVAWPLVVVVTILILRRPLSRLLGLLKKLKYKDLEAEFAQLAKKVKREAPAVSAPESKQIEARSPEEKQRTERLAGLLAVSPAAAVLDAWRDLEKAAQTAIQRHQVSLPLASQPGVMGIALKWDGLLSGEQFEMFERLRKMRNLAVHGGDAVVKYPDAETFIASADALTSHLNKNLPT